MNSAGDAPRRVRMDPDERRGQIVLVAARLFGERPYSEVSITDIAGEAGIARGLLHHYFGSKRELYLEVVRMAARAPLDAEPPETLGTPHAWHTVVDSFLDAIERNACPTEGACAGMFTANTMAAIGDALGMSLPGSASAAVSSVPTASPLRSMSAPM